MKQQLGTMFIATCLALGAMFVTGCRRNHESLVVNLLRDGKSKSFAIVEHQLLNFQSRRPKTGSGRRIIVQSILVDQSRLEQIITDDQGLSMMKPDLVLLDSSEQGDASAVARQSIRKENACGSEANCPVFIPNWVSGDRLEAAQQVLTALASNH